MTVNLKLNVTPIFHHGVQLARLCKWILLGEPEILLTLVAFWTRGLVEIFTSFSAAF